MKRFLSMLFVCCLCLGCLGGITVYAEGEATIAVSQASGFAGGRVTVEISVENNPGIAYLKVLVGYDANVLSVNSVTDQGLMTGGTFTDKNPYIFVWSQSANCEEDGVLATMVFDIADGAVAGESALTVTVEEVYKSLTGGGSEKTSCHTANGSVTVKEPVSSITSSGVVLGESIAMEYFAQVCPADVGAQMKFTMNGKETVVEPLSCGGSEYVYIFEGIAPQCMGDTIKAELIKDGEVVAVKESFSVRENLLTLLGKDAAELGYTDEQYAAMKTLIADLLEYGAAAQVYRNHATSALVNEGITGATEFVLPDDNIKSAVEGTAYTEDFKVTAAGVYFDFDNSLYLKLACNGYTGENSVIEFREWDMDEEGAVAGGKSEDYTIEDCEKLSSGEHFLKIPVAPTEFGTAFRFRLRVDNGKGLKTAQTVYYSVNSYVNSIVTGGTASANMVELAKTLYNYGLSASEFMDSL